MSPGGDGARSGATGDAVGAVEVAVPWRVPHHR